MIDFTMTENDRAILERTRAEALLCREHARYYDENEGELPPEELPDADRLERELGPHPEPGPDDTSRPVMMELQTMAQHWVDYSVRLRRSRGGLGNASLAAAGTA